MSAAASFLLRGGRVIDPAHGTDEERDLLVLDGRIAPADTPVPAGTPVEEVGGLLVIPGLVDIHVHFREPGQTHKEDVASGTRAAAAGGFTRVVCMPNTSPPCDNAGTLRSILDAAERKGVVRVHTTGCLTRAMEGAELAPIGSLARAGAVAVTDDGLCVQNNGLMRQIATYARMFGLPVLDHCQDTSLTEGAVMHEGEWSLRLGLRGWPSAAEEIIVARNLLLAEHTGAHIHLQHLSSARSVDLLREARARGVPVTAEATPHHIALTDAALAGYDPSAKMNPPLAAEPHRRALVEGLRDGTISCLATDHAPHREYEKDVELDFAPFGIIGLETALPVALEVLHRQEGFSLPRVVDLLTRRPAELLGLPGGTLAPGAPADLAVVDPDRTWTVGPGELHSRSRNTPWLGKELRGRAVATAVGGRWVYREGRILADNAEG